MTRRHRRSLHKYFFIYIETNYGVENGRESEAAGRAGQGNYSPSWLIIGCRVWANCFLGARRLLLEKADQTKKSNGNKHCQVCVEIWVWQSRHTSSSLPTRRRSVSCPPLPPPTLPHHHQHSPLMRLPLFAHFYTGFFKARERYSNESSPSRTSYSIFNIKPVRCDFKN